MAVTIAACDPYGSEIPRKLVGNWINQNNGNYDYGFFEEFAIAQNNFWKYKSINGSEIVLSDSIEEKKLTVNILTDSTITVNGQNYFKIVYPDDIEKLNLSDIKKLADIYLRKMSYFSDIKEDTTDFAPYIYFHTNSAKVMVYDRNTAKGWKSFISRFDKRKTVIGIYEASGFWWFQPSIIDTTEHYGMREVCNINFNSICEIRYDYYFYFKNWFMSMSVDLPSFVEPNDTLIFYYSGETSPIYNYRNEHYIMGSNQRFYREQDLFFNYLVSENIYDFNNYNHEYNTSREKYLADSTLFEKFISQCKMPLSRKFVHYNKNVMLYNFALSIVGEGAEDFFKQNPQIFNEREIMLTHWGVNFMAKYMHYFKVKDLTKLGFSKEFANLISQVKAKNYPEED